LVQALEPRLAPAAFTVNDSGDATWDNIKYPNDAKTTAGTYSLRSVLAFVDNTQNPQNADISFSGPMTITVNDFLPTVLPGYTLKVSGPQVAAFSPPQVSIVGAGAAQQYDGLFVRSNSTVQNVRVAGFQNNLDFEINATGVTVQNCFIGTDASGTGRGPAEQIGILVYNGCSNTMIQNNVISGNANAGIAVDIPGTGVTIKNNKVGTDLTGTKAVGNGYGLANGVGIGVYSDGVTGAEVTISGNTVAGQTGSGTGGFGVGITISSVVTPSGSPDLVDSVDIDDGNRVGVGDDLSAIPNGIGISVINSTKVRIGLGQGNTVVAGNLQDGIRFTGTQCIQCKVLATYIGVTPDGQPRPNGGNGLVVQGSGHLIGQSSGSTTTGDNVIAANKQNGIVLQGSTITVGGNFIGTDPAGDRLGNGGYGISIAGSKNIVGADISTDDTSLGNTIAFNGQNLGPKGHGIEIISGTGNTIRLNKIYMNAGRGIDLNDPQWYLNDSSDGDGGANNHQNHPTLMRLEGGSVRWMLNSKSNNTYIIDFYHDPDNNYTEYAEGMDWLGKISVTTDATGHAEFTTTFGVGADKVTATATDTSTGDTSAFSLADKDGDGLCDTWETAGVDLNDDGTPDLTLPGANPDRKDIYVQVDAMAQWAPLPGVLAAVTAAFAAAPVSNPDGSTGIDLHLETGNLALAAQDFLTNYWANFQTIKQADFGDGAPSSLAYQARLLTYHYAIFAQTYGNPLSQPGLYYSSGVSEGFGNDFMVTLGSTTMTYTGADGSTIVRRGWADYLASQRAQEQEGTFMHELGHNLGLGHTGPAPWLNLPSGQLGPSYYSVMNYTYQIPGSSPLGAPPSFPWRLDYSSGAINDWAGLTLAFQDTPYAHPGSDQEGAGANGDDAEAILPPVPPGTADLTVVPASPAAVAVGASATLTYAVANIGVADAAASAFALTLPAGVALVSANVNQGSVTNNAGTIQANFGTLTAGTVGTLTLVVSPTQPGTFSWTGTAATTTTDAIPGNNSYTTQIQATAAGAPRATGVQTNSGAQQYSMVTSLAITFSTVVRLPANPATAFTLSRIGDGAAVSFTASAATVGGVTVVTLSGFGGAAATAAGSLADGRYTLTALAAAITANGQQLDGNGDGTAGDNFTFADSGTTSGNQLYRLFGDADGNRVVSQSDLTLFRLAFGSGDLTFDVDGNGTVNQADLAAFRTNFGKTA
jgi:hypothetical protein